jgi:hypothetical protein
MSRFEVSFKNNDPDQPMDGVTLHYLNVGKTPGENCHDAFAFIPTERHSTANAYPTIPQCLDTAEKLTGEAGPDLLPTIENQHTVKTDAVFAKHWPDIKSGNEHLFFSGCLDCDISGGWSRLHICMKYTGRNPWLDYCVGGQQTVTHMDDK